MAYTFLVFDFGADEEAAQRAKQTVDRWKQAFRLDKKLLLKFDREAATKKTASAGKRAAGKKADAAGKGVATESNSDGDRILIVIRLDFSDHEKLSHQRWLDRIPTEEVFHAAHPKVIRSGDVEFTATAERFEELD
jgi:hypothetical protein